MVNVPDLVITSLDTITAFEINGDPAFVLDELQNTTISNTMDTQDITGKQGRKLASVKTNKACTISGTNGVVSAGLLEAQTGGDFAARNANVTAGKAKVEWVDYLTVKSNAAHTTYKAVGTAGAEIEALYIRNADGSASTKLTQDSTAAAGKFAYAPATGTLTFSSVADDTEIVVFYQREVSGYQLANNSGVYTKKMRLYIDGTAEDKCGNIYHIQFYIPKGEFNGEFDFEMGDGQSVHSFDIESEVSGSCGTGTAGDLWTFTVFGVNATNEDYSPST